jgi:hypothetical protein
MKELLFVLGLIGLAHSNTLPDPLSLTPEKPNQVYYVTLGGAGVLNPFNQGGADLGFGFRTLNDSHNTDIRIGVWPWFDAGDTVYLGYVQCNYLYNVESIPGLYLGSGCQVSTSFDASAIFPDIPLTAGYQFSTKKLSFIQLQVFSLSSAALSVISPLFGGPTPVITGSVNFGFGF